MYILLTGLLVLFVVSLLIGWFHRKTTKDEDAAPPTLPADCCGAHEVCERDSLLVSGKEIIYYDDEELDAYSGKPSSSYTEEDIAQIEAVFNTLQETDVAGWLRSLQLRNIDLPNTIKDEALLIVSERRGAEML